MKDKLKVLGKYSFTFILIVTFVIILMICVAKISKEFIKQNIIESAEYLNQKPMFCEMIKGHDETKLDHYADAITLNIAYNFNNEDSLKSILYAKYYGKNGKSEIENLLKTVTEENCEANTQYIRYWHGTTILLRVLLLVLNVQQIYVLNAIILIALIGFLIYKLLKNKMQIVAIGLIIALVMTNSFVVPFALEYINMYFVTIGGSILLMYYLEKNKEKSISLLFFVIGILTCFFDFLTTETMTLLIPLIILLVYKYRNSSKIVIKEIIKLIIKFTLIWLVGYVLMWTAKWGIASIYLNENIKDAVIDNAMARITKSNAYEFGFEKTLSKSVGLRNLYCLFPICNFNNQGLIVFVFGFLLFTFLFFERKEKNICLSVILFLIALVPYIRYLVINNHSYIHYFFTYRAQLTTILAIVIGTYYMLDIQKVRRKFKCKMKKN